MKSYEAFYQKSFELFKFNALVLDEVLKDILEGRVKEGFRRCSFGENIFF